METAPLRKLTGIYLRVANLTFGGGDPTTVALYAELVRNRKWLPPETYGLVFALSRVTPGTNILAFIAGSAWTLAGWSGATLAVLAASLPGAVMAVMLSAGYESVRGNPLAMAAIGGALAAAVGLMTGGARMLILPYLTGRSPKAVIGTCLIAVAAFALPFRFGVSPIQVLALVAAVGFFWRTPARQ